MIEEDRRQRRRAGMAVDDLDKLEFDIAVIWLAHAAGYRPKRETTVHALIPWLVERGLVSDLEPQPPAAEGRRRRALNECDRYRLTKKGEQMWLTACSDRFAQV